MKWKSSPPHPEWGKTGTKTKFLWLPTECPDGVTRWLVRVEIVYECHCNWAGGWDIWKSVKEL